MKTNFKTKKIVKHDTNIKPSKTQSKKISTEEEFEEFILQSGAKGSFMIFRSEKKGDELDYTATVSRYFSIADLWAIKKFIYTHDVRRLLQMAHQRYEENGKEWWRHDEKWSKYCMICQARKPLKQLAELR